MKHARGIATMLEWKYCSLWQNLLKKLTVKSACTIGLYLSFRDAVNFSLR